MYKTLTAIVLFLLIACQKEADEPTVYQVDKEVEPYIQTFVEEAQKRGIEIKLENLIVTFSGATDEICGQSITPKKGNGQRTIIINNKSDCWKNVPTQNREALVFHELGHCFLGRVHRDGFLPNGAEASIMNTRNYGPYEPCIYPISGDTSCNKTPRRPYYLDELFNPQTPVPAWAK